MTYVFEPQPIPTLGVVGDTARFPVHRIYCVGRNYADHAREMGHDPSREPPFFFYKPADSLLIDGADFPYPAQSSDVHHEIELVAALQSGGDNIAEADALGHVFGYGVGLDMTRRDLQGEAKKMGRPWDTGKGFEFSAPCSDLVRVGDVGHPQTGRIWLDVNGQTKQQGDLADLIWSIPEMIAYLSTLFTLRAGDLIMTGTPAGVGPVEPGQTIHGAVEGVGEITLTIGPREG
jgi:fumarylpyruvate hydrolase